MKRGKMKQRIGELEIGDWRLEKSTIIFVPEEQYIRK